MKKLCILNIVAGIAILIIPTLLLPVCSNLTPSGAHMGCYYTRILSVICGAVIFILGLLGILLPSNKVIWRLQFVLVALISLFAYLAPMRIVKIGNMQSMGWQVGLCKPGMEMACREHTWPVLGPVLLVLAALNLLVFIYISIARSKR